MKQILSKNTISGWTYYIDWRFAWIPIYCQGTFVWLRRVWITWPEDKNGKRILASDVIPDWFNDHPPTYNPEMYLTEFPYDPRSKEQQDQFLRDNS